MSAVEKAIEQFFAEAHKSNAAVSHKIGTAVNVRDRLCDVQVEGEPDIHDVLFQVVEQVTGSYVITKPKSGSQVIVGFTNAVTSDDQTDAYLAQVSEIDSIVVKIGNTIATFNSNGVKISNQANDFKQVINNLIDKQIDLIDQIMTVVVPSPGNTLPLPLLPALKAAIISEKQKLNTMLA
jgi:hypothetical protein